MLMRLYKHTETLPSLMILPRWMYQQPPRQVQRTLPPRMKRDLEKLKLTAEKNGIARYLELRRLLKAYDSVDIENLRYDIDEDSVTEVS
ncbi:hypothetical protein OSTOST_04410 [Ostertagia ostertagi]